MFRKMVDFVISVLDLDLVRCWNCEGVYKPKKDSGVSFNGRFGESTLDICEKCLNHPNKLSDELVGRRLRADDWNGAEVATAQAAIRKFKRKVVSITSRAA